MKRYWKLLFGGLFLILLLVWGSRKVHFIPNQSNRKPIDSIVSPSGRTYQILSAGPVGPLANTAFRNVFQSGGNYEKYLEIRYLYHSAQNEDVEEIKKDLFQGAEELRTIYASKSQYHDYLGFVISTIGRISKNSVDSGEYFLIYFSRDGDGQWKRDIRLGKLRQEDIFRFGSN